MLEFLPQAVEEASAATAYYEACSPELAMRFSSEVATVCAAIANNPLLWRKRPGGYRRVNLSGFPYYVAYFIRGDRVLITAIGHASRHPDYWKKRS